MEGGGVTVNVGCGAVARASAKAGGLAFDVPLCRDCSSSANLIVLVPEEGREAIVGEGNDDFRGGG